MKTPDWMLEGDYWRCRWCGSTGRADAPAEKFEHSEDCSHYWDEPPESSLQQNSSEAK